MMTQIDLFTNVETTSISLDIVKPSITLFNSCCIEEMSKIQDESIDLVVTDPPYKIISGGCRIADLGDEPSGILTHRQSNKRLDWVAAEIQSQTLTTEFKYVNGNTMKVNANNVLDQYFTKKEVASELYKKSRNIISNYEKSIAKFQWIEPSAGDGIFFNLLPKNKRIGIDINPLNDEIIKSDYLKYALPKNEKIIVIGNPPFGHRGVMALNFINHSKNADYVCFILPMFFESKGKGSIKYRVKGFNLIHSERLVENAFYNPNNNKSVDVKCVFQIWSKNHKTENEGFSWYKHKKNEPFGDLVKIFTVSLAKKRECGKKWIYEEKADYYLSSTFHTNISVVDTFEEVKYKSGVAIVLTTQDDIIRNKIKTLLQNVDWTKYGSLATNSCYHIGKSNIFDVFQDNIQLLRYGK